MNFKSLVTVLFASFVLAPLSFANHITHHNDPIFFAFVDDDGDLQYFNLITRKRTDTREDDVKSYQVSGDYIVFEDSDGDLKIFNMATEEKTDTQEDNVQSYQVSGDYVVFVDNDGDLKTYNLITQEREDTRLDNPRSFSVSRSRE